MSGGASLEREGVTFILNSSGADNKICKIKISGNSDIDLSAPTSDPAGADGYSGVLFYRDRDVTGGAKNNRINGGSNLDLQGALYFPAKDLDFNGGGTFGDGCTQLIGKKVTISGDAGVQGNCNEAGTRKVGRLKASLGE